MENAADALKIAFAIFVFVLAITIAFSIISQAKSTADVVLYHSDETNFYDYSASTNEKNRKVLVSDVISTLYRYYKESLCVTINLGSEDKTYKFDLKLSNSDLEKLGLRQNPATEEAIELMLANFIENMLLKNYSNSTFLEEFVEVPIGGIYETGEDGTQVTLSSGEKKIYITYTLQ